MERFSGIRRVLRVPDVERDLDEELDFHFARTVEELMADGLSESEAGEEARRRFGDERFYRRELWKLDRATAARLRWAERWEVVADSVRFALRRMRRAPGFTAVVTLTFALGIGANATMFGILDRLLLSPPAHIADAGGVKRVMVERYVPFTGTREIQEYLSYPDYRDFTRAQSFSAVAAHGERRLTVGQGRDAVRVDASLVSGNYFSLLGVRPALGRFFARDEARVGGAGVVVLSHEFWQRRFGGDRRVLGETLDFGYGPYDIIGVAPRGFTGEDLDRVDVWLPLAPTTAQMRGGTDWIDGRNWYWLRVVARLARGAVPSTAGAEATTLHRQGRAEAIEAGDYDPKAEVLATPLIHARGPLASEESAVATWLAGISAIVLLIVCANVANLLLARSVGQRRETGVRLALGSSRGRILGQALTESLLLAVLGGAAALLITRWGGDIVRGVLLPDVSWEHTDLELRVAGVIGALALLAGIVSGVLPAFQSSRSDFMNTLKSTAASSSRTRGVLTVIQAAMSVVLLIGAGLFVRSLHQVEDLDLGFDPAGVLLIETEFESGTPDERLSRFFRRATERLDRVPGVAHASAALSIPFWSISKISVRASGVDSIPMLPTGSPAVHVVDHDHFDVMGLQVLRGRGLRASDTETAARVVVVNETMARVVWPGEDAIGECLIIGGEEGEPEPPCATVIGVVENTRSFELVEEESMHYYVPLEQAYTDHTPEAILVRTRGVGQDVIPVLRRELLELEPALRFAEIVPLQDQIDPRARSWKLGAALFAAFGVLALVVAAIGLYSVLAFSVAQRTFEIGVRSALGATRERLMGLILGQALRLTGIGIALGLAIALLAGPSIEPLLFDVSPHDPLILTSVAILLGLVALLAGCVPAWRATRVAPSVALKAE